MYPHGGDVAFISRPVGNTWYRFRQLDPQGIRRVGEDFISSDHQPTHLRPRALGTWLGQHGSRIEKAGGQLCEAAQDIGVGRVDLHRATDAKLRGGIHQAVGRGKKEIGHNAGMGSGFPYFCVKMGLWLGNLACMFQVRFTM
jgi:hypothetical protein